MLQRCMTVGPSTCSKHAVVADVCRGTVQGFTSFQIHQATRSRLTQLNLPEEGRAMAMFQQHKDQKVTNTQLITVEICMAHLPPYSQTSPQRLALQGLSTPRNGTRLCFAWMYLDMCKGGRHVRIDKQTHNYTEIRVPTNTAKQQTKYT